MFSDGYMTKYKSCINYYLIVEIHSVGIIDCEIDLLSRLTGFLRYGLIDHMGGGILR